MQLVDMKKHKGDEQAPKKKGLALKAKDQESSSSESESSEDDEDMAHLPRRFTKFMKFNKKFLKHRKGGNFKSFKFIKTNEPPICFGCNKQGHIKANCPLTKKDKDKSKFNGKNKYEKKAFVATWDDSSSRESEDEEHKHESANMCFMANHEDSSNVQPPPSKPKWILDSGYSGIWPAKSIALTRYRVAKVASSLSGMIRRPNNGVYTVGDFMTKKEDIHAVKPTTSVDEALQMLVEYRITGLPVIDDDWKLVGVVSDYDLLALDSISGSGRSDTSLFPEVDGTWKTFDEIQKLLSKTNGKVIGELMTPAPLVVCDTTNLEDAARLLLETKYRRLPVVDSDGKLVGIITRGNVVRAALEIKRAIEKSS